MFCCLFSLFSFSLVVIIIKSWSLPTCAPGNDLVLYLMILHAYLLGLSKKSDSCLCHVIFLDAMFALVHAMLSFLTLYDVQGV